METGLGSTTTRPRTVICVPLANIIYVTSESAITSTICWPTKASTMKLMFFSSAESASAFRASAV